jgi:predicted RNA-binding Zn-ribbon protein involved in translation (DUF1610 family)
MSGLAAQVEVAGYDVNCSLCGRPVGASVHCQYCSQVRGLPVGIKMSSVGKRLGSYLLEGLLVLVTLFIGWLIWALIIAGRGQSPAKQVLGMRIVHMQTGSHSGWGRTFLRDFIVKPVITFISAFLIYIPLFWLVWDKNNQELWDKVMDTIVIDDPQKLMAHGAYEPVVAQQMPVAISAAPAASAATKSCPDCGEEIASAAKVCRFCGYRYKSCPDCAEIVNGDARVCRHCGHRFEQPATSALGEQEQG